MKLGVLEDILSPLSRKNTVTVSDWGKYRLEVGVKNGFLQTTQRAHHPAGMPAQYMGIQLGGPDILVTHQFLDGADIMSLLQKMRCKAMALMPNAGHGGRFSVDGIYKRIGVKTNRKRIGVRSSIVQSITNE